MENAKVLGQLVGQIGTAILNADANRDGNVSKAEGMASVLGLTKAAVFTLPGIDWKELAQELHVKNSEARTAALEVLAENLKASNEKLEKVLEDTIWLLNDFLGDGLQYADRVKTLATKWREVLSD